MRTTMTLDQTVYQMLKELARHNKESIGTTASRLIKQAIGADRRHATVEDGFPTLPEIKQPVTVTSADVESLGESLGI